MPCSIRQFVLSTDSTNVLVCVPPRKASPQLSSKSFSGKDQPQVRAKRHKKSFSVSGVKMFMDDGSREDEVMQGTASALSVSPGEMENRSRGSSGTEFVAARPVPVVSDDMGARRGRVTVPDTDVSGVW